MIFLHVSKVFSVPFPIFNLVTPPLFNQKVFNGRLLQKLGKVVLYA